MTQTHQTKWNSALVFPFIAPAFSGVRGVTAFGDNQFISLSRFLHLAPVGRPA
jgi:hypothetical protein